LEVCILNIAQLKAMLKRRGYGLRVRTDKVMGSAALDHEWIDVTYLDILRGESFVLATNTAVFNVYEKPESWATLIDVYCGKNQHHMQCVCGLPVLRTLFELDILDAHFGEAWDGGEDGPQFGVVTTRRPYANYHYRPVSAGPDSQPVTRCPACRKIFSESTVKEVED
jgi:hypothetical protein